jgi:hypothetical protein
VATNSTNGSWSLTLVDKPNDETTHEPNATGDKASLHIPQAGATFKSNALSSCVVTAAPGPGGADVVGNFNDSNTITDVNAPIPTSGSGCTSTTALSTATVTVTPTLHDVS